MFKAASQQTLLLSLLLFYCQQTLLLSMAPHLFNARGRWTKCYAGSNKKLGELVLFCSKLLLLSLAPHSSNARGRWPKCYAWDHESPEDSAASQQTFFIVSGSPIHPLLEGGEPNHMLGVIKVLGIMLLQTCRSVGSNFNFSRAITNPWFRLFYNDL